MRRLAPTASAPAVAAAMTALAACGSTSPGSSVTPTPTSGGTVVFTGDITGTWHKGGSPTDSDCGTSAALIHIIGPATDDVGNLKVTKDGGVLVDIEKYGDFTSTSGGTFHGGKGFDINADVATARGKRAHVEGSLSC